MGLAGATGVPSQMAATAAVSPHVIKGSQHAGHFIS
jgi:hypothetical protein